MGGRVGHLSPQKGELLEAVGRNSTLSSGDPDNKSGHRAVGAGLFSPEPGVL